MKIVFLDFDGVLNSYADLVHAHAPTKTTFNRDAVLRLNRIVEATGAKVVVSSSWRVHHNLDDLRSLLKAEGFVGEIIDCTPIKRPVFKPDPAPGDTRSEEIQTWLDALSTKPACFIVLDDMVLDPFAQCLVLTDAETGLLDEHVELSIALLGIE